MPAYAILEPPRRDRSEREVADRFVFLRERFGWGAFLFGPLWMIWRRLWGVLIVYLAAAGLLAFALSRLEVSIAAWVAVALLVGLLIGFEASNLRRWTLIRRGWQDHGTVIAHDLTMAEWRFFSERQSAVAAGSCAPGAPFGVEELRPGDAR